MVQGAKIQYMHLAADMATSHDRLGYWSIPGREAGSASGRLARARTQPAQQRIVPAATKTSLRPQVQDHVKDDCSHH